MQPAYAPDNAPRQTTRNYPRPRMRIACAPARMHAAARTQVTPSAGLALPLSSQSSLRLRTNFPYAILIPVFATQTSLTLFISSFLAIFSSRFSYQRSCTCYCSLYCTFAPSVTRWPVPSLFVGLSSRALVCLIWSFLFVFGCQNFLSVTWRWILDLDLALQTGLIHRCSA